MNNLLLHVCCGPCGIYPLDKLKTEYNISVFYYNPNIHPDEEYKKRREAASDYCKKKKINFICPNYNALEYFKAVKGNEYNKEKRCPLCYELRLEATAKYASKNNYKYYTSTLLISPHQDINLIKALGNKIAKKYKITFYSAEDTNSQKKYKGFRPGFSYGRQKCKQEKMYTQSYCGCIFSRNEV